MRLGFVNLDAKRDGFLREPLPGDNQQIIMVDTHRIPVYFTVIIQVELDLPRTDFYFFDQ
jgi:hypothetical protein